MTLSQLKIMCTKRYVTRLFLHKDILCHLHQEYVHVKYYFTKFSSLHVAPRYDILTQTSAYNNDYIVHVHLKGPSQRHLCFCLHARIWLFYFTRSLSKRRKITLKLLKIIKHTFRNTAYSKTIRIHLTMLYQ